MWGGVCGPLLNGGGSLSLSPCSSPPACTQTSFPSHGDPCSPLSFHPALPQPPKWFLPELLSSCELAAAAICWAAFGRNHLISDAPLLPALPPFQTPSTTAAMTLGEKNGNSCMSIANWERYLNLQPCVWTDWFQPEVGTMC